jgi:pimeloyl-ACP methyl ester carboxylesterase
LRESWLQNRFPALHREGWTLFDNEIGYEKSACTVYGFVNPASNRPNMLLLHGLGTSWNTWANSVTEFADEYNVYILDMPWNCSRPCPFQTLAELTEWTLGVLKIAKIAQPVVMTHSYGGIIMLNALTKLEAGTIAKLIVCSLGWMCGGSERDKGHLLTMFLTHFYDLVYSSLMAGIRPGTAPDTIHHMCNRVMETLDRQILGNYFDIGHQDALPFPEQLHFPILLIAGEDDFLAPKEDSIRINRELKGSQYVCIPKAKHFPMVEAKEAFYEVVRRFSRAS